MDGYHAPERDEYGEYYRADRHDPRYVPEVLIVFLHGILSSPHMWTRPVTDDASIAELLTRSTRRCDVFLYRYPSFPGQRSSNPRAARDLTTKLELLLDRREPGTETLPRPLRIRHLMFVNHSNGGIVCKLAVLRSRRLRRATRAVINLAVPHDGGQWILTPLAIVVSLLNLALFPVLWLASRLSFVGLKRARGLGYNNLFWHLSWPHGWRWILKCPDLRRLEAAWLRQRRLPPTHDFGSTEDLAIAAKRVGGGVGDAARLRPDDEWHEITQTIRRHIVLRGGHLTSSMPMRMISELVAKRLVDAWDPIMSRLVAGTTQVLVRKIERSMNIAAMVGHSQPRGVQKRGQQHHVLAYLRERVRRAGSSATTRERQKYIVLGSAGTGKSRMVARLAHDVAMDFIEDTRGWEYEGALRSDRFVVPILIQLQKLAGDVTSDGLSDTSGAALRSHVISGWSRYVQRVAGVPAESLFAWTMERVERGSHMLILDGIDDIGRRMSVDVPLFLGHWRGIHDLESTGHSILIGTHRADERGDPGPTEHVDEEWQRCRVKTVDKDTLAAEFPKTGAVIEGSFPKLHADRDRTMSLLLTPLVLAPLEADPEALPREPSVAKLLLRAVQAHVRLTTGRATCEPVQTLALAIVARVFYVTDTQASLSLGQIREGLDAIDTGFWEIRDAKGARRLLHDSAEATVLLETTLQSDGTSDRKNSIWTFSHDVWKEFLVAYYYRTIIEGRVVRELGANGYTPDITGYAAALMPAAWTIDAEMIDAAARLTRERDEHGNQNVYFLGNALALAVWKPEPRPGEEAAKKLVEQMLDPELPPFCRYFIMNGLCVRAFDDLLDLHKPSPPGPEVVAKTRMSLGELAKALLAVLGNADLDAISRSQAWLYLARLAEEKERSPRTARFPLNPPPQDWPALGDAEEHRAAARSCHDMASRAKRRVLQSTFVDLIRFARARESARRIATAHYVYILACIHYAGATVDPVPVKSSIVKFFEGEDPVFNAYTRNSESDEVLHRVLETCRRMAGLES